MVTTTNAAPIAQARVLSSGELRRLLLVLKSNAPLGIELDEEGKQLLKKIHPHTDDTYRGVPVPEFRAALEEELARRDELLPPIDISVADSVQRSCNFEKNKPKPGKVLKDLDEEDLAEIHAACKRGGGDLSFEKAEETFGLRQNRGNTARRACLKHEKGLALHGQDT
jgi:hypothetical protein